MLNKTCSLNGPKSPPSPLAYQGQNIILVWCIVCITPPLHDSFPFISSLTASDLTKESLFHKSKEAEQIRAPENGRNTKSPRVTGKIIHRLANDSEGSKPLGSIKGSVEQTLPRLEAPSRAQPLSIWISWSALHFQTAADHAAHLKHFAALMLLCNCARFFHPRGQVLHLTVFCLTVCLSY